MAPVADAPGHPDKDQLENWFLLTDPAWRPLAENDEPPAEAVIGLWPLDDGGRLGRFQANPRYRPADATSPSDPLDAVFRLMITDEAQAEHVQLILRESMFDLALNDDGRPLVTRSPDGALCAVAATSEPHRLRVTPREWLRLDLGELMDLLDERVDVFFNPGGQAGVRLENSFLYDTLTMDDDTVDALYDEHAPDDAELRVATIDLSRRSDDTVLG